MPTVPLTESATAVFGSDRKATVSLGPTRSYENWHIARTSVSTTSTTQTQLFVYRQIENPKNLVEGSATGNQDTSDSAIELRGNERIVLVWTGGDVGQRATVTLEGEREV